MRKSAEKMSHLPKNVTWEWDISTLKRSFYVNFMLPKDLFNYKKLQDNFLTRLDPPPPYYTILKKCTLEPAG